MCDPEFDQVASFVNRFAVFVCFRTIQRHSLTANWADRTLKGEQLIVVHLGPSGTRAAVLFFKLLIAPICLSVRQRTQVLFFLLGQGCLFRRRPVPGDPVLYAL